MDRTPFGTRLRRIRLDFELSQSEFAERVRQAGRELGEPNECTKRLVQMWESPKHSGCRPNYRRALTRVTGVPYQLLCAPLEESESPAALQSHPGAPVYADSPGVILELLDFFITQLTILRIRVVQGEDVVIPQTSPVQVPSDNKTCAPAAHSFTA